MRRFESYVPTPRTAYALLVLGAAIWGSGIVIARGVHEFIPPVALGVARGVVALCVLAPLVLMDWARVRAAWRRHWRLFVLLGFLQMWPQTVVLIALNYTTAINATLINGAQPAMAAILLWALYGDRVTLGQGVGIALALGGIVVMVTRGDWQAVTTLEFNVGDWLTLGAILLFALYSIQIPRLPRETGLATTLFLITLTGTVTMTPVMVYEQMFIRQVVFDGRTIATMLWMGIVISTASILLWNMCLTAIGTQKSAIFLNLNPIFAALFAIAFLGEELFVYHLAGAVLVLGGITLVIRRARRGATAEAIAPKVEA